MTNDFYCDEALSGKTPVTIPALPWFGVFWFVWTAWSLPRYVTMPLTITMTEEGRVRFIRMCGTTPVAASEEASVETFALEFFCLKHARGRNLLLRKFTGIYEFLNALKQANSRISTREF